MTKLALISLLAGALASCATHGFANRPPGSPAVLEVTLEQSVTKHH